MVHRNFERTEELVNNLLEMNARVGRTVSPMTPLYRVSEKTDL